MDNNTELNVNDIIRNAFTSGVKNWIKISLTLLLFAVSCWIPYLNIGAVISFTGFIILISKDKPITPTHLFNKYYIKKFPDYALLTFLWYGGFFGAMMLLFNGAGWAGLLTIFVPITILSLTWFVSFYLCLDKDIDPIKSIYLSNKITHGYKGTIFGGFLLLGLCFIGITCVTGVVLWLSGYALSDFLISVESHTYSEGDYEYEDFYYRYSAAFYGFLVFAGFIGFAIMSLFTSIFMGACAYIYKCLEPLTELESNSTYK